MALELFKPFVMKRLVRPDDRRTTSRAPSAPWSSVPAPEVLGRPGRRSSGSIPCCSTARRRCTAWASRPLSRSWWRASALQAASPGLHRLQRRLRRRPDGRARAPVHGGPGREPLPDAGRTTTSCKPQDGQPVCVSPSQDMVIGCLLPDHRQRGRARAPAGCSATRTRP